MKNAAVFLAPGFEEVEALTVVDYLRRAEVSVVTVSVPKDGEIESERIVRGSHNIGVEADMLLKDFIAQKKSSEMDAVYFPGGMPGAKNLADSQYLFDLILKMHTSGKIVAAICAAPAVVLAPTGILMELNWTCYPGFQNRLAEFCGGEKQAKELTENSRFKKNAPFVFDTNVLTGRGPGAAEQFAMKLVEILAGKDTAKSVHDGSCQR